MSVKKGNLYKSGGKFSDNLQALRCKLHGFVERLRVFKTELIGSEVYLEVGFEDLSHFSFVFKKEFGRTPSEVMQ